MLLLKFQIRRHAMHWDRHWPDRTPGLPAPPLPPLPALPPVLLPVSWLAIRL